MSPYTTPSSRNGLENDMTETWTCCRAYTALPDESAVTGKRVIGGRYLDVSIFRAFQSCRLFISLMTADPHDIQTDWLSYSRWDHSDRITMHAFPQCKSRRWKSTIIVRVLLSLRTAVCEDGAWPALDMAGNWIHNGTIVMVECTSSCYLYIKLLLFAIIPTIAHCLACIIARFLDLAALQLSIFTPTAKSYIKAYTALQHIRISSLFTSLYHLPNSTSPTWPLQMSQMAS